MSAAVDTTDSDSADDGPIQKRKKLSDQENEQLKKSVKEYIESKMIPLNDQIKTLLKKTPMLAERSFAQIKSKVQYQIKKHHGKM